jgi:hypothetical protein
MTTININQDELAYILGALDVNIERDTERAVESGAAYILGAERAVESGDEASYYVSNVIKLRAIRAKLIEAEFKADLAFSLDRAREATPDRVENKSLPGAHPSRSGTYSVIRFYSDGTPSKTIQTGLTLSQAQTWCRREDTHGTDANGVHWFDGYEQRERGGVLTQ